MYQLFNVRSYDPVFPKPADASLVKILNKYFKNNLNSFEAEKLREFAINFKPSAIGSFFRNVLTHAFFEKPTHSKREINQNLKSLVNNNGFLPEGLNWYDFEQYFILLEFLEYINKSLSEQELSVIQNEIGHYSGKVLGEMFFYLLSIKEKGNFSQ